MYFSTYDHFHLSLQSGSNTVLKRMNRKYTTEEFREKVTLIREYMPNAGITTDIIVGFPGETDSEFTDTYDFVEEIKFSQVHVFKYSPRKGTPAALYENQIDGNVKNERSKKLIELTEELTKKYCLSHIGKELEVLVEEDLDGETEFYQGYTTNYIKVLIESNLDIKGKIVKIKMKDFHKENLIGDIIT